MLRCRSHPHTFQERLAAHKTRLEQKAAGLRPGPERDELLRQVEQIDRAADIHDWLSSPPSQRPR